MFTLQAPQRAVSAEGYVVQVASRDSVEYLEGAARWVVTVDFGRSVAVYAATLRSADMTPAPPPRAALIVERIIEGLQAMGCKVERC